MYVINVILKKYNHNSRDMIINKEDILNKEVIHNKEDMDINNLNQNLLMNIL